MKGNFETNLFWPSFLIAAAIIALAVGVQLYAAREADRSSLVRDETLVKNGMSSRIAELGRKAVAQTSWDEAVVNLDNSFSLEWAMANVGRYMAETEGFEAAIVLDSADQPLYAMREGKTVEPGVVDELRQAAAPLVARVRDAERARGAVGPRLANGGMIADAIVFGSVSRAGGELFVLSAILVQPDFGTALPRTDRSAIVITGEAIDSEFISSFAQLFLLTDAKLYDEKAARKPGLAQIALRDSQDKVVAKLQWTPPTLGADLLRKSLPTTMLLISCLGTLAWFLYQKGCRATQSLIASEARASHLASHDVLTGLANRALLADRLAYALDRLRRTGKPFAIFCIDLDRFKEINDTFGHGTGDDLLRAAAQRIAADCRLSDILARLGGDEFAIVRPDVTVDGAVAFASRLLKTLSEPIELPVSRVFIGSSIGIAVVQNGDIDPPECLRQADLALYRAKDAGRGCFALFEPEMDAAVRLRRGLQADLRRALHSGDEIWLAYQPQVDARGRIVGVEALVRWTHPEGGEIAPSVFVPLAEESGLIEALGMQVLRRAFEDSTRFGDLTVAINISAAQLRMTTFIPQLTDLLAQMRVDPSRFELEITEGLLLSDDSLTHESLRHLRALGFRIALDDFGTGYSSLSYLQRYPIDKIKIDRSFVINLGADAAAEAVVSAIVKLARALGLTVVAEGVETETQRTRLASVGCTDVQGYLFGKPVTVQQLEAMAGIAHAAPRALHESTEKGTAQRSSLSDALRK
jgi:diguanylate cyclase (GGDEF)-like protein